MRLKKKICILLAMVMMVSVIPCVSFANDDVENTTVDTIYITDFSLPKEGKAPDYNVTLPTGCGYHLDINKDNGNELNGVSWAELVSSTELSVLMPGEAAFEVGKVYSVTILIAADEGYSFALNEDGVHEVQAYINGMPALVSAVFKDKEKYLSVATSFPVVKEYDLIVHGGAAYNSSPNNPALNEWDPVDSVPPGASVRIEADYIDGWEFDHWEVLEGNIGDIIQRSTMFFDMPESDIRIRAYFTDGDVVTYFHNVILCFGETPIAGQSVANGKTAVEPEDPGQEGMVFKGWYTQDGVKYDFSKPVTEDVTLTAKFVPVDREYDLIVYGGIAYNNKPNDPAFNEWDPIDSAPPGASVRIEADYIDGWEFDHWEVLEGTLEMIDAGSIMYFEMPEVDIKVRAYYTNGDTETYFHNVILCFGETPIAGQTVANGMTAVEPEDPAQEGMVFEGWYTLDGEKYDFSKPVTENVTLTAKFTPVKCEKHVWGTGVVVKPATCTANGTLKYTCKECNETKTGIINKASNVKLSAVAFKYDGKVKNPIIIKDSKGKVISTANYTIVKPAGRKNVGQYTYKIKFKNQYAGTKNLTFKINPKGTTVSSLAKGTKSFIVKWKKQSEKMAASRISGYQIQYSKNKNFTNATLKTVKGYNYVSLKAVGLQAKTTYYVRVRTYKTVDVDGKKVNLYSGWSKYDYVKTK